MIRPTTTFLAALIISTPATAAAEVFEVFDAADLGAALRNAGAGDQILVSDGTYEVSATLDAVLQGTADAPITISAAVGARPVLQGPANGPTLQLQASFTTIEGLEFAGSGTGLVLSGESIDLRELTFSAGTSGVHCESCVGLLLLDSEFTGIGPGPAFEAAQLSESDLAGNYVHDTTGPGFVIQGIDNRVIDNVVVAATAEAIAVRDDTANPLGNLVSGNYVRGATLVLAGAGTIDNNIVWQAPERGIVSDLSTAGAADVFVLHNTVVAARTCFAAIDWPLSTGVTVVANNAFYCADGAATLFESGVGENSIVTSNVYLGTSDFPGDSVLGTSAAADFADAEAGNFYPADGSPLIDAGDPDYLAAPDFNGSGRSVPPDVGAYERSQSANPFPDPASGFKGGSPPSDADAGADAGLTDDGGASGPGQQGSVNSGSDFEPRHEGCQCSSLGNNAAGGAFLALILGFLLAGARVSLRARR